MTLVFLKDEDVRISDDIKAFDHDVDSGSILTKHFCSVSGVGQSMNRIM